MNDTNKFDTNKCPYYETKCADIQCPCAKYKAYLDVQNPQTVKKVLVDLHISDTMNLFEKIYNIQQHFASRFHIVHNIPKDVTEHWCKEYCICMEDEIEELFDYIILEDNREIKADIKELKKEIVDVLHFVLDQMIAIECDSVMVLKYFKQKYFNDFINDPLIDIFNYSIHQIENIFDIKRNHEYNSYINMWNCAGNNKKWNNVLKTLALRLLFINREIRQQISWKHWRKPFKTINYEKLYQVCADLWYQYMLLAAFVFDNAEELVQIYIKKNVENICRQKYNY